MIIQILFLVIAFFLLAKGADLFVDGASGIAKYFKVSPLFIGLTVAAIGTSAPEASVSIQATLINSGGIALGNIIGSNIANICLAIGISALIKPMFFEDSTIKKEIPFLVFITILLLIFGLHFSTQNNPLEFLRIEGIILLILFIGFLFYLSKMAVEDRKNSSHQNEESEIRISKAILLTLIGGVGIVIGGKFAVTNSIKLAETFGVSQRVIGISVIAFGTSIPEIVTAIVAVRKNKISIAMGNIVGSNIFNILFVLGLASTINPITVESAESAVIVDIVVCLTITIIFFVVSKLRKKIGKIDGIILLIFYFAYIFFLFSKN